MIRSFSYYTECNRRNSGGYTLTDFLLTLALIATVTYVSFAAFQLSARNSRATGLIGEILNVREYAQDSFNGDYRDFTNQSAIARGLFYVQGSDLISRSYGVPVYVGGWTDLQVLTGNSFAPSPYDLRDGFAYVLRAGLSTTRCVDAVYKGRDLGLDGLFLNATNILPRFDHPDFASSVKRACADYEYIAYSFTK
jgi:hypothetical protein